MASGYARSRWLGSAGMRRLVVAPSGRWRGGRVGRGRCGSAAPRWGRALPGGAAVRSASPSVRSRVQVQALKGRGSASSLCVVLRRQSGCPSPNKSLSTLAEASLFRKVRHIWGKTAGRKFSISSARSWAFALNYNQERKGASRAPSVCGAGAYRELCGRGRVRSEGPRSSQCCRPGRASPQQQSGAGFVRTALLRQRGDGWAAVPGEGGALRLRPSH